MWYDAVVSVAVSGYRAVIFWSGTVRADLKWKVLCKNFFREAAWHDRNSVWPVQNIWRLFKRTHPRFILIASQPILLHLLFSLEMFFLVCFCTFSSLISDITLPFYLYNTILFFFSGPFLSSLFHFSSYSFVNLQGFVVQLLAVLLP